jgi:pyruvate/2-oxoglutarate dehydrogenase complex dihydrolipoamide dehydrogenase (E3) component
VRYGRTQTAEPKTHNATDNACCEDDCCDLWRPQVTLIEAGTAFLGFEEPEAGAALRPHLEADGIIVMVGDPGVAVERQFAEPSPRRSPVVVHLKSGAVVSADRLLVATGRRPPCLA